MFGTYRLLLAFAVCAQHLLAVPNIGGYSVHGFFVLSGFLMTMIMQERYGYTAGGFGRYAANRALRLLPANFVIVTATIVLLALIGRPVTGIYMDMALPRDAGEVLTNYLFLNSMPFPFDTLPRISPPSWALSVEIVFYLLIGLGISSHKWLAVGWLVLSTALTAYLVIWSGSWSELDSRYLYFFMPSASLPFSIGAVIYHYRSSIPQFDARIGTVAFSVLFIGFIVNGLAGALVPKLTGWEPFRLISFYANFSFHIAMIIVLIGTQFSQKLRKKDSWIGDLSYPVYLSHFGCALLVSMVVFGQETAGRTVDGLLMFAMTVPVIIGLSAAINQYLERPIEHLRRHLKDNPAAAASPIRSP